MPSLSELSKKEFKLKSDLIYLNHAAVSPWPARTAEAVKKFADENMTGGSLRYPEWLKVESALRHQAGELLNAPSAKDIALLKNTSESLSVVAYGLDWRAGDNIITSNQEFPSNRIVWESLESKGVEFREADLTSDPTPEEALFLLADESTRLITISSVQFGTGLRMDLEKIGNFCKSRDILFCVDAIQSIGALQIDVQEIKADFVMADGHKWMLGPEGLAIFYTSPESRERLKITQYGWHMVEAMGDYDRKEWALAQSARRFECGSPNMIGIHALNASLSLLNEAGMENVEREVLKKSEYLFGKIRSHPDLELITSDDDNRYAGIVTFRSTVVDNEVLFQHLTDNHVFCALRGGGLRLSPHFYTPVEHLSVALRLIDEFRPDSIS
jgi:selenocysteine lyase/cysteine desulfurase